MVTCPITEHPLAQCQCGRHERGGGRGRVERPRDLHGTEIHWATLAALDNVLRDNTLRTQSERRTLSDMVRGSLDYWAWADLFEARRDSWYGYALLTAIRVALAEWVQFGSSARVELQNSLRQFFDALGDPRWSGEGTELGVQSSVPPHHTALVHDYGEEG